MSDQSDNIETLIARLNNGDPANPDAEWQAALALGDVAEQGQATTALIALMGGNQAHALTRAHAVQSLGRIADAAAIPILQTALTDSYQLVRAYAASALGSMGQSEEQVNALLPLLDNDPFFGVRAEVAAAVANIAARINDAALTQRVRDALTARRAVEVADGSPGSVRVIAEIDRSLNERL